MLAEVLQNTGGSGLQPGHRLLYSWQQRPQQGADSHVTELQRDGALCGAGGRQTFLGAAQRFQFFWGRCSAGFQLILMRKLLVITPRSSSESSFTRFEMEYTVDL